MKIACAAVIALAFVPLSAKAETRIAPVLSTSMQRACQGETGQTILFDATGRSPVNQPQVARDTRSFRAARAGNGYAFEQGAVTDYGETFLRVNVAADGAISDATLSGAGFERAVAESTLPVDVAALANSLAQEIPERLVVGRSFAVGDQLYPEDIRHTLVGQMTSALGMPFPVSGAIDIPFIGEQTENDRRVYVFEGDLQLQGEGQLQGTTISVAVNSHARIVHDAETALIVRYDSTQQQEITAGGQPFLRNESHDRYSCQIIPQ
jgi:hypothetical protein